jgi:hypothetical protein
MRAYHEHRRRSAVSILALTAQVIVGIFYKRVAIHEPATCPDNTQHMVYIAQTKVILVATVNKVRVDR